MRVSEKIDPWLIIHMFIGGAICFVTIFVLEGFGASWRLTEWIFKSYGSLGVFIFEEARNGYYLIRLGLIYLPAGFLGGLYLGYKVKEKLKVNMVFPSIIGFTLFLIYLVAVGYPIIGMENILKGILIPLFTSTSGSYLGGYTLNWHVEDKPKEERISLIFEKP